MLLGCPALPHKHLDTQTCSCEVHPNVQTRDKCQMCHQMCACPVKGLGFYTAFMQNLVSRITIRNPTKTKACVDGKGSKGVSNNGRSQVQFLFYLPMFRSVLWQDTEPHIALWCFFVGTVELQSVCE